MAPGIFALFYLLIVLSLGQLALRIVGGWLVHSNMLPGVGKAMGTVFA